MYQLCISQCFCYDFSFPEFMVQWRFASITARPYLLPKPSCCISACDGSMILMRSTERRWVVSNVDYLHLGKGNSWASQGCSKASGPHSRNALAGLDDAYAWTSSEKVLGFMIRGHSVLLIDLRCDKREIPMTKCRVNCIFEPDPFLSRLSK